MLTIIASTLVVLGLVALLGGKGLVLVGAALCGAVIGWGIGIYTAK